MKRHMCTKCKEVKDINLFNKRYDTISKIRSHCKDCVKSYNSTNRKRIAKRKSQWYQKNKQKSNENSKEYYQDNKEDLKLYQKTYRDNNKEKVFIGQKRWRENHRDIINEHAKRRRNEDPLFKLSGNIRNLVNKAFKRNGFNKQSKVAKIIGCTFVELHSHLWGTFEENYGLPRNWIDTSMLHIDHIIPISTATTLNEVIELNNYTNLQYLLAEDNLEKKNNINWEIK